MDHQRAKGAAARGAHRKKGRAPHLGKHVHQIARRSLRGPAREMGELFMILGKLRRNLESALGSGQHLGVDEAGRVCLLALVSHVLLADVAAAFLGIDRVSQVGLHRLAGNASLRIRLGRVAEKVVHVAEVGASVIRGGALRLRAHIGNAASSARLEREGLLVRENSVPRRSTGLNHVRVRAEQAVGASIVGVLPAVSHAGTRFNLLGDFRAGVSECNLHLGHRVDIEGSVSSSRAGSVLAQHHLQLVSWRCASGAERLGMLALLLQTRGERVLALVSRVDVLVNISATFLRVDRVSQIGFDRLASHSVFRILLRGVAEQIEHVAEVGPSIVRGGALTL